MVLNSSETIEGISAKVIVSNNQKESIQSVPNINGTWMHYTWDNWEEPIYHERLKKSYYILKDAFKECESRKLIGINKGLKLVDQ